MNTQNTPRRARTWAAVPARRALALLSGTALLTYGTSVRQLFDLTLTLGS
ncbi:MULTISPECIES: hypothetical protein [Kitasatospora]|nr:MULTISPECIES: hypothetical protein [Kitasatospora]